METRMKWASDLVAGDRIVIATSVTALVDSVTEVSGPNGGPYFVVEYSDVDHAAEGAMVYTTDTPALVAS